MKTIKIALWAIFTLGFLVSAVSLIGQNQDPISVEMFNYITPTYPKWVILLTCVFLGAIISTLFFLFELMILETRNVRLRRMNQKLERALAASSPITNASGGAGPSVRVSANPSLIEEGDV